MKIKSMIFLLIMVILVVVNIVVISFISKSEKMALEIKEYKKIEDNYFTFQLPSYFQNPKIKQNNGWNIESYYFNKNATFRLSRKSIENPNFDKLCVSYFALKDFSKKTAISKTKYGFTFYKKINLVENGVYVMRKKGKSVNYIYFFTINNNLYWFDFYPKSSFVTYKTIFDNILKSITFNNQTKPDENFSKQLKTICTDSYFLFCQPYEIFFLLPVSIILIAWFITYLVSIKMGRKPTIEVLAELNPVYSEENAEFATLFRNKKQYTNCFFAITSQFLVIYKFGKEFIKIPLKENRGNFIEKTGFFGNKFIEIKMETNDYYIKKHFYNKRKHKIRIYSNNTSSIMAYLT